MKNYFRVSDACRLYSLQGVTVLAGSQYLGNIINHINVMEVPDIENWVQKDEFLMTTGYMYQNDPLLFVGLIPKLKQRGIAALGIKPKRFLDTIPDPVIECAENNHLPLLLLPEQTAFSLVIRECMEKILLSEKENRSAFLKNLLLGNYNLEEEIYTHANQIGLDFQLNNRHTLLLAVEHEDHVNYEKESIYQTLKLHCSKIGFPSHHIIHQNHIVIILSYPRERIFHHMETFRTLAQKSGITLCSYSPNIPVSELPVEYKRILKMAKAVEYNKLNAPLLQFNDLGLYSILPDISDSLFHNYCLERYLLPLQQYDQNHSSQLVKTLRTYLQCNCNMKETAVALFTHYNTVCYRISQIQELLDINLHDMNQVCTLYIAFLFHEEP